VVTLAGTGVPGFLGDGGAATAAALNSPSGVAVDSAGNVYVSDNVNERVRRIDRATRAITTLAGTGQASYSGDGGAGTNADLNNPQGLAVDPGGTTLYIADFSNNRVRRVNLNSGTIDTVAGTGVYGFSGDGGPAVSAQLAYPVGLALDGAGNLFIADQRNQRIRRVDRASGVIITVAGNGQIGFSGDGGPATAATFNFPVGVVADSAGNLFIVDQVNERVRRIDKASGTLSTVAGNGSYGFSGDGGPATAAQLANPTFLAFDSSGNLLVVDQYNNRIRAIAGRDGTISTVAGTGTLGFGGDGEPPAEASFNHPDGIAVGADGAIYICDQSDARVRRVGR
jgi:DNA-binding beta-propeller fold protein YncE